MPFSPCVRLMDHSVNSSRGKASSANKLDQISCAEESGWTSYFEDFSRSIEPSYCSSLGGSSLVSDASSCAAWKKFPDYNNNLAVSSCPNNSSRASPNRPKKLCFKKAIRAKQISEDDPLEDTASSPVNSPKVHKRKKTVS